MGNCRIVVQLWQEKEIILFIKGPYWLWGLPSLLFRGYWDPFPRGFKWLGYKAVHSPPSAPEIKADGAIPPVPYMPSWHALVQLAC